MTDTFLRQYFASETEANRVESAQEFFSETGKGPGEPPRVTHLEGRATSKSEIQRYLDERRKERRRKTQRKYMRKYMRAKRAEASIRIHPTLPNQEAQALLSVIAAEANAQY